MPETEWYPRPTLSYKVYSVPRNHIEMAVLIRDLREHAGEWGIYTYTRTYQAALACIRRYKQPGREQKFLLTHADNIQLRVAVDPETGPMVVIRWVDL